MDIHIMSIEHLVDSMFRVRTNLKRVSQTTPRVPQLHHQPSSTSTLVFQTSRIPAHSTFSYFWQFIFFIFYWYFMILIQGNIFHRQKDKCFVFILILLIYSFFSSWRDNILWILLESTSTRYIHGILLHNCSIRNSYRVVRGRYPPLFKCQ